MKFARHEKLGGAAGYLAVGLLGAQAFLLAGVTARRLLETSFICRDGAPDHVSSHAIRKRRQPTR